MCANMAVIKEGFSHLLGFDLGCSVLVALLWMVSVQSAEICGGIASQTLTEPVNEDTSCIVTGKVTVGANADVANNATLSLFARKITFANDVSVADGGQVHVYINKPINDTGITTCSDATTNGLPCPVSSYPDQDAEYGRDATANDDSDGHAGFSFTKLDTNGNPLPASATTWSCVKDNVTGLVWEVKTVDGGIHDKGNTYRWGGKTHQGSGWGTYYNDWDTLVDGTNAEQLCGYSDWRVPNIKELVNLVNNDQTKPVIDTDYFPNTPALSFWSSTPAADYSFFAWFVDFHLGDSDVDSRDVYNWFKVRLVRSGE